MIKIIDPVDPVALAHNGGSIRGVLSLDDLPRLAAASGPFGSLRADCGVDFDLVGECDGHGAMFLSLRAGASLILGCQRCLNPFLFRAVANVRLRLQLADDPELILVDENDDEERVDVTEIAEFSRVLEDELLLSLPISPRHEFCTLPGPAHQGPGPSPFSELAALRSVRTSELY